MIKIKEALAVLKYKLLKLSAIIVSYVIGLIACYAIGFFLSAVINMVVICIVSAMEKKFPLGMFSCWLATTSLIAIPLYIRGIVDTIKKNKKQKEELNKKLAEAVEKEREKRKL